MAVDYAKPLPTPDLDTLTFWEACRAHELRAQRCSSCGQFRWPPNALCSHCRSWDFEWARLAGTGSVYSFVVVHYSAVPAFAAEIPYVVAHITMDETDGAVRLISNVIDCPLPSDPERGGSSSSFGTSEQVRVGMPVEVVFEDVTPEVSLPKFRPVGVEPRG